MDKKAVAAIVAIVVVMGIGISVSLSVAYTSQQQLEEQRAVVTALVAAGTAQSGSATAQVATATILAQSTRVAHLATATAEAQASATLQAARATAQAQATSTARTQLVAVIVTQMRDASELTTAVFAMQSVVKVTQQNDPLLGFIPNAPTELTYKAHGEVRAGFDLNAITQADVEINGDVVTIRLPPPKILAKAIDESRSEVYREDVPWFGVLKAETVEQAHEYAMEEILNEACRQKILDQANQNADSNLAKFLATLGFSQVRVITQAAQSCP